MVGFLSNTDMRFLTESKGRTCNTSNSTNPSPGKDTCTVFGVLRLKISGCTIVIRETRRKLSSDVSTIKHRDFFYMG